MTPTSEAIFDIAYDLQLDIGGGVPKFLTNPVLLDTVKQLDCRKGIFTSKKRHWKTVLSIDIAF